MVLAEAAVAGILLGLVSGGRLSALGELRIRRVELVYASALVGGGLHQDSPAALRSADRLGLGAELVPEAVDQLRRDLA